MGTPTTVDKFPLWLHQSGQWTKKVCGKMFYFGTDRDTALAEYVRVRDDLEAGRVPRPKTDGVTVAALCNEFLTAKRERVESGELSGRMWSEYHRARTRAVDDLRAGDFGKLRSKAAKRLGPFSIAKFVQMVRTIFIFIFAYDSELIDRPIRYGASSINRRPAFSG